MNGKRPVTRRQRALMAVYRRLAEAARAVKVVVDADTQGRATVEEVDFASGLGSALAWLRKALVDVQHDIEQGRSVNLHPSELGSDYPHLKRVLGRIRRHLLGCRRRTGAPCPLPELERSLTGLTSEIPAFLGVKDEVTPFQIFLKVLMDRCQLRIYGLARISDVTERYIKRLLLGERRRPSRGIVVALGQAMVDYTAIVSLDDLNKLVKLAGHPPLPKRN